MMMNTLLFFIWTGISSACLICKFRVWCCSQPHTFLLHTPQKKNLDPLPCAVERISSAMTPWVCVSSFRRKTKRYRRASARSLPHVCSLIRMENFPYIKEAQQNFPVHFSTELSGVKVRVSSSIRIIQSDSETSETFLVSELTVDVDWISELKSGIWIN